MFFNWGDLPMRDGAVVLVLPFMSQELARNEHYVRFFFSQFSPAVSGKFLHSLLKNKIKESRNNNLHKWL